MWKKAAPLLIVLSVAVNLAFIGVWASHAIVKHRQGRSACAAAAKSDGVWCPLHRRLNVNAEQWRQLEPHLVEFRRESQSICMEIDAKRREMIDLISSPQPDKEAIAARLEEILAAQRRVQHLVVERLLAEKEVLTPEQQKQVFDMLRRETGCTGHDPMTSLPADESAAGACLALPCANQRPDGKGD